MLGFMTAPIEDLQVSSVELTYSHCQGILLIPLLLGLQPTNGPSFMIKHGCLHLFLSPKTPFHSPKHPPVCSQQNTSSFTMMPTGFGQTCGAHPGSMTRKKISGEDHVSLGSSKRLHTPLQSILCHCHWYNVFWDCLPHIISNVVDSFVFLISLPFFLLQ